MKIYGTVGIVTYDPIDDRLQCHLCGKWRRSLGVHVVLAHGWTADDYREEFGLNRQQTLICEGTKEKLSRINKELGQWKQLNSQTMTKPELLEFLNGIRPGPGHHKLREQSLIQKSKLLRENNPMNEAEAKERARAKLRESYYLSERIRIIGRNNLLATIAKQRERNLAERRWPCPCGQAFPTREEANHHRRHCAVAQQKKTLSEEGKKTYLNRIGQFQRFLDGRQPTPELAHDWMQQLLDKGRKPATVRLRGWALRRYFSEQKIMVETNVNTRYTTYNNLCRLITSG